MEEAIENTQDESESILDINLEEEMLEKKKRKALHTICTSIAGISAMDKEHVAAQIAGKTIHSATRCKAAFRSNLKRLKMRLEKTTTAKVGKAAFKDDLYQLLLNLEDVNKADLHGNVDIQFRRYVPGKCMPQVFD